ESARVIDIPYLESKMIKLDPFTQPRGQNRRIIPLDEQLHTRARADEKTPADSLKWIVEVRPLDAISQHEESPLLDVEVTACHADVVERRARDIHRGLRRPITIPNGIRASCLPLQAEMPACGGPLLLPLHVRFGVRFPLSRPTGPTASRSTH